MTTTPVDAPLISVCALTTGDLVYLGKDRVAAKVLSVDLDRPSGDAGPTTTSEVVLTYLETENLAAGYRQATLAVTACLPTVAGGAA